MPPPPWGGNISRKELEFNRWVLASPIDKEPLSDSARIRGNHPDHLISMPDRRDSLPAISVYTADRRPFKSGKLLQTAVS